MARFLEKAALAAIFGLCMGLVLLIGDHCSTREVAYAQEQSLLTLQSLMSPEDFANCGLKKLTPVELANLNQWLEKYTLAIMRVSSSNTTTAVRSGPNSGLAPDVDFTALKQYEGAKIIAQDGTFLGVISTNKYDQKSLANKYGNYGSKYQTKSIVNKYGTYGSAYADYSPFNKFSTKPPLIIVNEEAVAYLTVNTALTPRVDPNLLFAWLEIER